LTQLIIPGGCTIDGGGASDVLARLNQALLKQA
jgi:hypothetical protein